MYCEVDTSIPNVVIDADSGKIVRNRVTRLQSPTRLLSQNEVIDSYFVNRIPEIYLQDRHRRKVQNPRVIPNIDLTSRTMTHLEIASNATTEDMVQVIKSFGLECNGLIGGERNTGPNARNFQRFWLDPCDDPKLPGFWELNHAGD